MGILGNPILMLLILGAIGFVGYLIFRKSFKGASDGKTPAIIDLYADIEVKPVDKTETKQAEKLPEVIEKLTTDGVMNALVLDDAHRTFGLRHIETIKGKEYGRPRLYLTNMVFKLQRLANGQILPVPPSLHQDLSHSPGETYEAVKNNEDVRTIWGRKSEVDRVKFWILILAICATLFIGWMAVTGKKSG